MNLTMSAPVNGGSTSVLAPLHVHVRRAHLMKSRARRRRSIGAKKRNGRGGRRRSRSARVSSSNSSRARCSTSAISRTWTRYACQDKNSGVEHANGHGRCMCGHCWKQTRRSFHGIRWTLLYGKCSTTSFNSIRTIGACSSGYMRSRPTSIPSFIPVCTPSLPSSQGGQMEWNADHSI